MPNVNDVQPRVVTVYDYIGEGVTLSEEDHLRVQHAPDPVAAFKALAPQPAPANPEPVEDPPDEPVSDPDPEAEHVSFDDE